MVTSDRSELVERARTLRTLRYHNSVQTAWLEGRTLAKAARVLPQRRLIPCAAVLQVRLQTSATVLRAAERGWVVLRDVGSKSLRRSAALTDEGRLLARKSRCGKAGGGVARPQRMGTAFASLG
jgi:hypothetical protein